MIFGLFYSIKYNKDELAKYFIDFSQKNYISLWLTKPQVTDLVQQKQFKMLRVILTKNLLMLIPKTKQIPKEDRRFSGLLPNSGDDNCMELSSYNEKYIKVSDFLDIILSLNLPSEPGFLDSTCTQAEEKIVYPSNLDEKTKQKIVDEIKEIVIEMQHFANYGKISNIILDWMLRCGIPFDFIQDNFLAHLSAEYKYVHKKDFIMSFINESIVIERIDITYELVVRNINDLSRMGYLYFLDTLISTFKVDKEMMEVKLAIVAVLIPYMSNMQTVNFMKTIETMLEDPPEESLMRVNLNPLRVCMIMYKVIDDIQHQVQYSSYATKVIKEKIKKLCIQFLELYENPEQILQLVKSKDILDNDCLWYMLNYQLYQILDTKILDLFMMNKWQGWISINSSIL